MQFDDHQRKAVRLLKPGSILVGGTGSGKSRTALVYFFTKECGGRIIDSQQPMTNPKPLYIITTAPKRDKKEWEEELKDFQINNVVIDSWNNIKKYTDVVDSFFIFDEQRVVGSGAWSKSFLKITKKNNWILLSATPGDTWSDYIPVFIANGFYRNRTEFLKRHAIFSRYTNFPKIERYVEVDHLEKLKASILIQMNIERKVKINRIDVLLEYNKEDYNTITKDRWDIFNEQPIENASQFTQLQRRIVNSNISRIEKLKELLLNYKKIIVFYNFNYERDLMIELFDAMHISYGELNGHNHTNIPKKDEWAYIVQYNSGSEGWNCIETNVMVFYSLSYSYRMMHQAAGRINRRNTLYEDLYYFYFYSDSTIDKAILKSLEKKKDFNEKKYYEKMTS